MVRLYLCSELTVIAKLIIEKRMTKINLIAGFFFATLICFTACSTEPCDDIMVPAGFVCIDGEITCTTTCEANEVLLANCTCATDADSIIPDPCLGTPECPEGTIKAYPGCNCVELMEDPCENVECGPFAVCVNGSCQEIAIGTITITSPITENTTWTADNIYVVSGKIPVDNNATLTIEPGTVIKGATGTDINASALVIARGAKIMAEGTAELPIIFTSILDEIRPGQIGSPNLTEANNGLWGGLIVLGYAPISAGDGDDVAQIEGIAADDIFGRYGGTDPADNSGVIRYVSVRHGGAEIGAGNEINGITFGGVGSGTVVENIEVLANADDGIEWFGGTVNVTNAVVADCDDDGIDIDQNYSGTITNAFVVQSGATGGDNALEIDGPEGSLIDGLFTINGVTLIDEDGGSDFAADLKSKTQGTINNASWRGFAKNVMIRQSCEESDCSTTKSDSYQNYLDGLLKITNSEWVGNAMLSDWTTVYGDKDCADNTSCNVTAEQQALITDLLSAEGNVIANTPAKGADASAFANWSWVSVNNRLN